MVYGAPHIRSRWAPASDPPINARGSFHTSRAHVPRGAVVVLGDGPQDGAQLVGDHDVEQRAEVRLAALGAISPTTRPRAVRSRARTRRRGGSRRSRRGAGTRRPRVTASARASAAGSRDRGAARCARVPGTDNTSDQPGKSQIPQKLRKLMFIGTWTGMVSATSRPPSSGRGRSRRAGGIAIGLAGVDGEHVPVQRPVGGRMASREQLFDLVVGELVEATLHDALRAWCRDACRSPRTARRARRAWPNGSPPA